MGKAKLHESNNAIIPQRYIPFDLGARISKECANKFKLFFERENYKISNISGFLNSLSKDVLLKIEISDTLRLYIFSYGMGVFVMQDDLYQLGEKYAVDYCEYRKNAHKELLEFRRGDTSSIMDNIIDALRKIVKEKETYVRASANKNWEYSGLSYVMTVSFIVKKGEDRKDYEKLTDTEKKNLQIMLQPSLAHKEDSMAIVETDTSNTGFDPFNFDVNKMKTPKNWIVSEDCSIYISWAAVVAYVYNLYEKYMEVIECLEVDLQAMWLYTYCQYLNLKFWPSSKKRTSSQLKKEKFNFQRKYNEFISDNDSSIPVYIEEIRGELIRTSGIEKEKSNYSEYIDFCIDEIESEENEQQRKYSVMNEILLFIIAFIQIAPMLYSALLGKYVNLEKWPIAVMIAFVVVAIIFIIRKD